MGIELYEDDFVWLDPGPEYGSIWDLCRPLEDEEGNPIFLKHGDATADNFYILCDAGAEVRRWWWWWRWWRWWA